jgi:hypothetical protein
VATARAQLAGFIAKYSPDIGRAAKASLATLRNRFAGTHELVYDNYNALVIAWSTTGKVADVICSIALYPKWINLFFMRGTELPDPDERLQGNGKTIRHVTLERGAATLAEPAVRRLLAAAIAASPVAPRGKAAPACTIKSVSAKQRPRKAPSAVAARRRAR